jgi:hypothetical protein
MVKQGLTSGNAVNTHSTYQSAAFWPQKPNNLIGWISIEQYTRRKFKPTNQSKFKFWAG